MNKTPVLVAIMLVLILSISLVSAFWPFDWIFGKTSVTGEVVNNPTDNTPFSNNAKCSDGDGGIFSKIAGKVRTKTLSLLGRAVYSDRFDRCASNTILIEYYCNKDRKAQSQQMKCENGCENGACKILGDKIGEGIHYLLIGERGDIEEGNIQQGNVNTNILGQVLFIRIIYLDPKINPEIKEVEYQISSRKGIIKSRMYNCLIEDCTNVPWYAKENISLANENYSIKLLLKTSNNQRITLEKNFSLSFINPSKGHCKDIFPGHNNMSLNRQNIILFPYVNLTKNRFFYSDSCNYAALSICSSEISNLTNRARLNYLTESNNFKLYCFKNGELLGTSKKTLQQIHYVDKSCAQVYPSINEIIQRYALGTLDLKGNYGGLFSLEPFKSNTEKFNLWTLDEPGLVEYCSNLDNFGSCQDPKGLLKSCNLPNKLVISFIDSSVGISNAGLFTADSDLSYGSFPSPDFSKSLFIHETGHVFGLGDEYYIDHPGSVYNQVISTNTCYSGSDHTQEDCLKNAKWKDYIGRGCGNDSVVDCTTVNESYFLEVGCFEGCRQEFGIFRPTINSIMNNINPDEYSYSQLRPRLYGPWNEKIIGDNIRYFTGK